jgi:hypothetical protein
MTFTRIIPIATLCFALMTGCATPQTDVVKKALNSYMVGVTTFADFRSDAGLIALNVQTGKPEVPQPKKYNFDGRYGLPSNSSWKLYGSSEQLKADHGRIEQKWTYKVGDASGPICNLCFNSSGELIEIYLAK